MNPPFLAYNYVTDKQPFVFVSYDQVDIQKIYPIIQNLHENGIRIWYEEGSYTSNEWFAKNIDAIKHSNVFITFLSQSSNVKFHMEPLISYGLKRHNKNKLQFIIVFLEKMMFPKELGLGMLLIEEFFLGQFFIFNLIHRRVIYY